MTRTTPNVNNETLTWQHGEKVHHLTVGTADWYVWLEQVSTFAFTGPTGTFTARKEPRQRGGAYWKAYRKRAGKLHRVYLGKSNELTLARLQAVATALAEDMSVEDDSSEKQGSNEQQTWNRRDATAMKRTPQMRPAEQVFQPGMLPIPLTPLIGREEEQAQLYTLLTQPQVRLVTLVGPGGVGKTRLTLQVAIDARAVFPDGVFFVPFASVRDPRFVLSTIAQVLGVHAFASSSVIERVQEYLQNKQLLLVLDNLEHLLKAVLQLEQLLLTCPSVKLLVTSRTVLHIQGEHEFPLLPLALPNLTTLATKETLIQYAAVALFVQRAQAVLPTFQITEENARSIAAICVRLDGLPLALELAAASIKLFPPQALLHRLSHRLHILMGRRASPGIRSLRSYQVWQRHSSILDWSMPISKTLRHLAH